MDDPDVQKQIELLKKQKELLDASRAALEAQKALADAQKPADPAAASLTRRTTDLKDQKALVDAQKALLDAQAQTTLAQFIGDVKAGPYSGSVTMKEKAGTEEAQLLAARAVKEAAHRIAKAVRHKATTFYLFSTSQPPAFAHVQGYRFRVQLLAKAFDAAQTHATAPQPQDATKTAFAASITAGTVSAGLDAAVKLLGFFKTDYEVGGIDAKLDDSLLLFAVAGHLHDDPKTPVTVQLPNVFAPGALNAAMAAIVAQLAPLADRRAATGAEAATAASTIADLLKQAEAAADAAAKASLLAQVAALKPRVDQLAAVNALYDAFQTQLTTADANGVLPIAAVAQEWAVEAGLAAENTAVLLLRIESAGGGYLLKKNLWTGLGTAMPLYHMGGATVAYALFRGSDGNVIAGDTLPVYGGFVRSDALREMLQQGH